MLEGYYLRRPKPDDLQGILKLMIACDVRDVGFPDSDEKDLKMKWEQMDLETDAWIVFDKHHSLKGYGAVMPWANGKLVGVYDAPGTEETEIFLALSILCEGRARTMLQDARDPERITIAHYISDSADYQKKTLHACGYQVTKFLFNMHRNLDAEVPRPVWPVGYQLRALDVERDAATLHALIQDAFDRPGHVRQSFEEWKSSMMNPLTFILELWFILTYQEKIVGCALCYQYDQLGWVRQLAVRKDQRGKGFGRKLLQHAFSVFKQRGFPTVGLAVEAENINALALYQNAGMKKVVHLDEFSKKITLS